MKTKLSDIIRYKFDNIMSKGAIALVGILFLLTALVITIIALISLVLDTGSYTEHVWTSIMHVIDPGTITGAATDDLSFLILMSIVTLCGIFITSILIGLITTGFEEKLTSLKKGNARVIEKNHTIILGFNENIYTIISELIEANSNQKDGCIVILSEEDMETVEESLSKQIEDFRTTRIICRTGSISDMHMLKQCSIDTCRSVIINEQDDFMVTKTILAINNLFSTYEDSEMRAHVVATVCDTANLEAINIAGGSYVETILIDDTISRIIAQTCRQPGLSNVLIELFDYDGDELYFENFPELSGKTFAEALVSFEKAIVMGVKRGEDIMLNADKDLVLKADDDLIILVEDDGVAKPLEKLHDLSYVNSLKAKTEEEQTPECILILGINSMLERILIELDNYYITGSTIVIANEVIDEEYSNFGDKLKNIKLLTMECDTNKRENLDKLLDRETDHVLLLSDDDCDTETSDAMTLLKLIHLRDIAQKENKTFNITSEMKNTGNQKLAQVAKVNDLVVGSNIINLILTQISENRDLATVFRELLHADGSEVYLRKASNYVELGKEIDFYAITELAKEKNEIAMGYKKQGPDTFEIVTNPEKSEKIKYEKDDYIIVLSAD